MAGRRQNKGEAFAELVFEIAAMFFRMRAVGQRLGLVGARGATLGFLRSLVVDGPMTVPDLARMRPTSRQRMQQLADELAADGLIEFVDNPRHRKSKLMRLTRKGEAQYRAMLKRLHAAGIETSRKVGEADLRAATALIRDLRAHLPLD
jgi:DNA-binding MarR family transcriptional regulator